MHHLSPSLVADSVVRVLDACDVPSASTGRYRRKSYCPNLTSHYRPSPEMTVAIKELDGTFRCSQCGYAGDLNWFVRRAMHVDYQKAERLIAAHAVYSKRPCEHPDRPSWPRIRSGSGVERRYRSFVVPDAALLAPLGLDSVAGFDIRLDHDEFVFGLYNDDGLLIAYYRAGADRVGDGGRVLPPWNWDQALLFGRNRVESDSDAPVVVVDNPWDVVRFAEVGLPAVWPVELRPAELKELAPFKDRLVVAFSPDREGRTRAALVAKRLPGARFAHYGVLKSIKDVAHMKRSERRRVIGAAVDGKTARLLRLIPLR